ncbi:hypothetical protein M9H77_30154 [Catharanthus roseus]|uniref:Uncharacterized protein n=1 Tax=Catharanthus roseus TaxID=4058 RepID=A0ACB9ZZ20_CATRO|nr:hypothetical protein M9H77_30154 [Catharanthus roseus]
MLGSVTLDLDPVDKRRSSIGGLGPRRYCISLRIMLCDSDYFLAGSVRRGPPARVAQGGMVGIDYGMPEIIRRPCFRFRTLSVEFSACMFFLKFQVSWQRRSVLILSDFSATPEPFRKFILCIKVLKALTSLR